MDLFCMQNFTEMLKFNSRKLKQKVLIDAFLLKWNVHLLHISYAYDTPKTAAGNSVLDHYSTYSSDDKRPREHIPERISIIDLQLCKVKHFFHF